MPRGDGAVRPKPPAARATSSRPLLSVEFVAVHKRRRIVDAFAQLCAEKGYAATSISDLTRRAAVARKTIYDNFEGKEQIFLAAFDGAREEAISRIRASCAEAGDDRRERLQAGLGAFLGYLAERPDLARLCMVEALSATPASSRRYEEALQAFGELAQALAPPEQPLPETIRDSLIGGVAWIVYQQILRGEAERAPELLPELTEFMLAPHRKPTA